MKKVSLAVFAVLVFIFSTIVAMAQQTGYVQFTVDNGTYAYASDKGETFAGAAGHYDVNMNFASGGNTANANMHGAWSGTSRTPGFSEAGGGGWGNATFEFGGTCALN